jgi:hypothetical protein
VDFYRTLVFNTLFPATKSLDLRAQNAQAVMFKDEDNVHVVKAVLRRNMSGSKYFTFKFPFFRRLLGSSALGEALELESAYPVDANTPDGKANEILSGGIRSLDQTIYANGPVSGQQLAPLVGLTGGALDLLTHSVQEVEFKISHLQQSHLGAVSSAPQDGPHPQPPSFEDTTACNDGTHGDTQSSSESLEQTLKKAPKPALLALAGLMLLSICFVMFAGGVERTLIVPLLLGLVGIGVSWLRFNAEEGQLWTMLGGIAIIFAAYALYVSSCMHFDAFSMIRILCAGLALLIGVLLAIVPWIMALIRIWMSYNKEKDHG